MPYGPPAPRVESGWMWPTAQWQTCPVCRGKGTVPAGFYDHSGYAAETGSPTQCRSCSGRGIVQ